MNLDNDLMALWLKAPSMTTEQIRRLLEQLQEQRDLVPEARSRPLDFCL